ncbi:FliH/SctL family protein [Thermaerobacter litoralis]
MGPSTPPLPRRAGVSPAPVPRPQRPVVEPAAAPGRGRPGPSGSLAPVPGGFPGGDGRPAATPVPDPAVAAARARRWLARARRAAARHLDRARREAEALRRQAYEEGLRRGEAEGRARWEAACREAEDRAARQREDLATAYRQLLAGSAGPVLELVLALARRVAGEHLAADAGALRAQIEAALARLGNDGARVLLHPESLAQLEAGPPLPPGVEQVADLTLAPGDFRVETPRGHIDGRVAVQIERLGRVLEKAMDHGPAGLAAGGSLPGAGVRASQPVAAAAGPAGDAAGDASGPGEGDPAGDPPGAVPAAGAGEGAIGP